MEVMLIYLLAWNITGSLSAESSLCHVYQSQTLQFCGNGFPLRCQASMVVKIPYCICTESLASDMHMWLPVFSLHSQHVFSRSFSVLHFLFSQAWIRCSEAYFCVFTDEQFVLKRVADCAIDLYAMVVVLSRYLSFSPSLSFSHIILHIHSCGTVYVKKKKKEKNLCSAFPPGPPGLWVRVTHLHSMRRCCVKPGALRWAPPHTLLYTTRVTTTLTSNICYCFANCFFVAIFRLMKESCRTSSFWGQAHPSKSLRTCVPFLQLW